MQTSFSGFADKSSLEDEPWAYPRSKIEAEEMFKKEHGDIPAVILRLAGVYNEEGNSVPIGLGPTRPS